MHGVVDFCQNGAGCTGRGERGVPRHHQPTQPGDVKAEVIEATPAALLLALHPKAVSSEPVSASPFDQHQLTDHPISNLPVVFPGHVLGFSIIYMLQGT